MTLETANAAAILDRVIDPERTPRTTDPVHMLLDLHFSQADIKRMNQLAAKARAGTLTEKERTALSNYELVGHMLSLLKSKARRMRKTFSNGA